MGKRIYRKLKQWEYFARKREDAIQNQMQTDYGDGERCIAIKDDGEQCQSAAMQGGYFCKQHSKKLRSRTFVQ